MPKFVIGLCLFTALALAGCSSTVRTYTDTLKLAFNPGDGATVTAEQLASLGKDAVYATVGNLPRALLVLEFTEHGQSKWVSADNAMLVLEHGRLIKTAGFANDLLFSQANGQDPLSQPLTAIKPGQQWQLITDWAARFESGYPVQFNITAVTPASLEILDQPFATLQVSEQVTFYDGSTATNVFWFDSNSGELLKSQQQIAPFWPQVELIYISNAGRLLGIVANGSSK